MSTRMFLQLIRFGCREFTTSTPQQTTRVYAAVYIQLALFGGCIIAMLTLENITGMITGMFRQLTQRISYIIRV